MFKVISNKMSNWDFTQTLSPEFRANSQIPGAASSSLCSFFGLRDASLAHSTLEMIFFFIVYIRNGP